MDRTRSRHTARPRAGPGRPGAVPAAASDGPHDARPDAAVDCRYLESLVGYNVRRASVVILALFGRRMAAYDLRPVDFSILSLLAHNPGITSRRICSQLDILPPNLVARVGALDRRGLITRRPHPRDGRATGLYLTDPGRALMEKAEPAAAALELEAASGLSPDERSTLIGLLQKIYR